MRRTLLVASKHAKGMSLRYDEFENSHHHMEGGEKERGARFAADTSRQLGKIDIYE